VFFTPMGPGAVPGRRRHLCRVEEGGSIFAISGARGRTSGSLVAVGAGPAQLLRFARGDLIRLSFEEGLSEQVAALIDDWVIRVGRALGRLVGVPACQGLGCNAVAAFERDARFSVREGVGWVRHLSGASCFLDQIPIAETEHSARFPLTEHLWLKAVTTCRVTACDTVTMIGSADPWASLDDFHCKVLEVISGIEEREAQDRGNELRRSIAQEATLVESVSSRLAAATQTETTVQAAALAGDDALAAACRSVGEVQGIEIKASEPDARPRFEVSRDPLGDLARASGFHVRPVTLPQDWWRRRGGEAMLGKLVDEGGSPVSLLPVRPGWDLSRPAYELRDPQGRRDAVDERLARRIAPTAWVFYRSLPDNPLAMPDLARFGLAAPGLAREVRVVLAMALLGVLLGLSIPIGSGILLNQVIPEADRYSLAGICLFLVILTATAAIFQALQGLTILHIEGRVSATLIPAVWDRLLRLPSRFFARFSSGDLATRAMGLSEVFKKVSTAVVTTLVSGLFSFFNLGLLFYYSWRLALVTTVLLGGLLLVTALLLAGRLRHETSILRLDGLISGLLLELLGGILPLRSAGAEGRAFARWARRCAERLALTIQARRFTVWIHQMLGAYPILSAMVIYVGTVHLDPGLMRTGDFLAFTIAFTNLAAAVLAVGYTAIGLLELVPVSGRIKPIVQERPEFTAAVAESVRLTGALALNHVSFRYPGTDQATKVLDDVSLQVRPGEFVAIVGPSGSGKSTLMRLLLGFETPDSGTVAYDGRELATLDLRDVRRQLGVVLQHAHLLPGDIFDNIVGFAPFLTIEDAWQAARLASLEDDIRAMPMGMHTLVGEGGGSLSSGQRQRLLIARAIVRHPRILLLDEATSALDSVTQAIVSDSLSSHLRDVTRVVIAHRLDVVVKADRIYVLKEGKIVQSGRYHQLIQEPGPFRDMARRQML
jgi:ATP-binding cassette subfamily C protein